MILSRIMNEIQKKVSPNWICSAPMIMKNGDKLHIMAFDYIDFMPSKGQGAAWMAFGEIGAVFTFDGEKLDRRLPIEYIDCSEFDPASRIIRADTPATARQELLQSYCDTLQCAIEAYGTEQFENFLPSVREKFTALMRHDHSFLYYQVCPEFFDLIQFDFG